MNETKFLARGFHAYVHTCTWWNERDVCALRHSTENDNLIIHIFSGGMCLLLVCGRDCDAIENHQFMQ